MNSIRFANLRAEMARNRLKIEDFAEVLGLNRVTVSHKLSGKNSLLLHEAFIIKNTFFPDKDVIYLFQELYEETMEEVS